MSCKTINFEINNGNCNLINERNSIKKQTLKLINIYQNDDKDKNTNELESINKAISLYHESY